MRAAGAQWVFLMAMLTMGGCTCFQATNDCLGLPCADDAGARDDGGHRADAGVAIDAGVREECAMWGGQLGVEPCAAAMGYARTQLGCQAVCPVAPIVTPGLFGSLAECAQCGCNRAKLAGTRDAAVSEQAYCDALSAFTEDSGLLRNALPQMAFACDPNECLVASNTVLGDAGYSLACAASMVPDVTKVFCRVFLP